MRSDMFVALFRFYILKQLASDLYSLHVRGSPQLAVDWRSNIIGQGQRSECYTCIYCEAMSNWVLINGRSSRFPLWCRVYERARQQWISTCGRGNVGGLTILTSMEGNLRAQRYSSTIFAIAQCLPWVLSEEIEPGISMKALFNLY